MARNYSQHIMDILRRETDSSHSLSCNELIRMLYNEYGIELPQITVRRNIDALNEQKEQVRIKSGPHNTYLYSCVNSGFPIEDVRLLIDSLFINRFISREQKMKILDRFRTVVSRFEIDSLKSLVFLNDNCETHHDLLKNKHLIDRGIAENRYVTFKYERYGADKRLIFDGKLRKIIPLTVIYDSSKYYLSALDCLDRLNEKTFRIDKMADVRLLESITEEFSRSEPAYNVSRFEMFKGDRSYTAKFRVSRSLFDYMIERFGSGVRMRPDFDHPECAIVTQEVQHSKGLVRWILGQGSDIEVLEPEELREEVRNALTETLKKY